MRQRVFLAAGLAALAGSSASAQTTGFHGRVDATADIYGITGSLPEGATNPTSFTLPANAACLSLSKVRGSYGAPKCSSPEGCITINMNEPTNYNDPDGAMAQVNVSSNTGAGSISGIKAPGAGYLVGVFTQGMPSGAAPPLLDFTQGTKTHFTSLAPLLDQTFFVGDGRRKDDKAVHQRFSVPAGSTNLYLGISDACGFVGQPGCYYDNTGFYKVILHVSTAACPAP